MSRRLQLALLIVAGLVVVALIKASLGRAPDPSAALTLAEARMSAIEDALAAHAATTGTHPTGEAWAAALGLSDTDVADPFADPPDAEPLGYWSDGRWYALRSIGPDSLTAQWAATRSVDPELTRQSVRQFRSEFLAHRTDAALEALLGQDEIIGDIRFRAALYDPTNGLLSPGDLVRWGGPAALNR